MRNKCLRMQPEAYKIQQAQNSLPSHSTHLKMKTIPMANYRFQSHPPLRIPIALSRKHEGSRWAVSEKVNGQFQSWMEIFFKGQPCSGFKRDSEESIDFACWFHYERSTQDLILPTNLMSSSKCRTEFEVDIGPQTRTIPERISGQLGR